MRVLAFFRNVRVRQKVLGVSLLLLAIMTAVVVAGISGLKTLEGHLVALLDHELPAIELLLNIDRDAYQAEHALEASLLTTNPEERKAFLDAYKENAQQTWDRWVEYKELALRFPGEEAAWEEYEARRASWIAQTESLARMSEFADDNASLLQARLPTIRREFEGMRTYLNYLQDEIYTPQIRMISTDVRKAAAAAEQAMLGGLLAALVAGLGLAWGTGRAVGKPLEEAATALREIAEGDGDLSRRLPERSRDEVGLLARWFNLFMVKLNETVAEVRRNAALVGEATERLTEATEQSNEVTSQVAAAIGQVATGATNQTEAAQSASASMAHLAEVIRQIADGAQNQAGQLSAAAEAVRTMLENATTANELAAQVAASSREGMEAAEAGAETVASVIRNMQGTKEVVLSAAGKIDELGRHSERIGEIVTVIRDIADQTNLLALNAAIEAARAGEHGKGFAVVADEVRKLAERAARSAKEIADLIADVKRGTEESVRAMSEGTAQVEEGAALAAKAETSLAAILEGTRSAAGALDRVLAASSELRASAERVQDLVNGVAAIAEETSAAAEEMAAEGDQVRRAITEIASVSEENAASAEEVSASAEEQAATVTEMTRLAHRLAGAAAGLRQTVDRFKLADGEEGADSAAAPAQAASLPAAAD